MASMRVIEESGEYQSFWSSLPAGEGLASAVARTASE